MFDIKQYFKTSSQTIENLYEHSEKIKEILNIYKVSVEGKKVLVAGNGGSCSDAEHFVGELQCTIKKE